MWEQYRGMLRPNRKSEPELLSYLLSLYPMTERFDPKALDVISSNVTMNEHLAEKLPKGVAPVPRAFYLENLAGGKKFYEPSNKDPYAVWGCDISNIFVGIDVSSGFFMVEGSTLLCDELCAFQGVDEKDLQNYVITAQYLQALKRVGKLETVITA